ncbi:hypothetical protein PFISCL1PPCAC_4171 [Pristionchus fissidentatus]|uniref:UDP-glucuronosyltransferase n=1 Tax=Pristionchus fissidentatus TaxID=1538716 RepID=A0AAV5V0H7_9BILA|nr:hypothetical protein PFISCL1PPCAC_4171 [Pristionchus fissidentatus]
MRMLLILVLLLGTVESFKFLVHSTRFGQSHTNFLAKLADVLVDAGHEVVIVSPIMNSRINGPSTKARVIEIPQCQRAVDFEGVANNEMSHNVWVMKHPIQIFLEQRDMFATWGHVCESVVTHPGLLDKLKAEKFDVAFGESLDFCAAATFHLVGVEKWAVTESIAIRDGGFSSTQTPGNPAYVPSLMSGGGERMDFFSRLSNAASHLMTDYFFGFIGAAIEKRIRIHVPDLPSAEEMTSTNSLIFYNSEPLVDFPKITSARTIDIGGITVSSAHGPLNETWSSVMDLRPSTILISFGTVAQAFAMPEEYKQTIKETIRKFPDVTFIWKYEKPEHKISAGIPNLIESTWVPQRDMLHDSRLSAFITHCGQGSTTEAIDAGMPLIVIPVLADQQRNAHQIERIGVGLRLDKNDLSGVEKLSEAITEILRNEKFRQNARKVKQMIADRPFQMKEIFIRNMEFIAKHGPLRQLDHYGRNLNWIQYYLIDVIVFVVLSVSLICFALFWLIRALMRRVFMPKAKTE